MTLLFDLVIADVATSFIDDKHRSLNEYHRVSESWGFLSIINLFYDRAPLSVVVG